MTGAATERRPAVSAMTRRFAFPTQKAFLSQAVLLEEAGPPRTPALACLLGFALVAVAIVASMLIQIDVVTSSTGEIKAAKGNHVLQSFDGGIVEHVAVEEGQIVEAGDLLMKLNDPEGQAQLDRLRLREAALFAQVRRLQTLVGLPSTIAIQTTDQGNHIIDEQMSMLAIEQEALTSEQALIRAEIDRRLQTLLNARDLETDTRRRLALVREQLRTDRQLQANGLLPKTQLLRTEQEAADAVSELTEIQGQIRDAEAGLVEASRRLENAIANRKQEHGEALSSSLIDFNETRKQIQALQERLARAVVASPADGVVLELMAKRSGQTVAPGDPIAEVIPIDGGLVAETRLPPSEISYVHPGQTVRIAIDGVEPHRHGYLEGAVDAISPSTFLDENAIPHYRTTIRLNSEQLGSIPLTPGMTIQAQIKTDQRTILEYLLKPVYRAWNTAFRER